MAAMASQAIGKKGRERETMGTCGKCGDYEIVHPTKRVKTTIGEQVNGEMVKHYVTAYRHVHLFT